MFDLPAEIAKAKRRNIIVLMSFGSMILNNNLVIFGNKTRCCFEWSQKTGYFWPEIRTLNMILGFNSSPKQERHTPIKYHLNQDLINIKSILVNRKHLMFYIHSLILTNVSLYPINIWIKIILLIIKYALKIKRTFK